MSLKEFLKEEREERKTRKLQKKLAKKSPKTKEQKYYKIAGIIVGVLITFGALFSSCKNCGGFEFNWTEAVGITDEMIVELKKPVDENLLFIDGKITKEDYDSCIATLNLNEVNILENDEISGPNENFILSSKEVGSLVNGMLSTGDSVYFDILNFKIPITDNIDYLNKISSILRKIDLKIQKETDMLDLYIRQKSFFLKNLFI